MNSSIYKNSFESTSAANGISGSVLTRQTLLAQNREFKGSGGVSQENQSIGFVPAFQDFRTGAVHRSRFSNGRPAPIHVLDGLPPELVLKKSDNGRVVALIDSVIAGFLRNSQFYTRREAANFTNKLHAAAW